MTNDGRAIRDCDEIEDEIEDEDEDEDEKRIIPKHLSL